MSENTTATIDNVADVPFPAGATRVGEWRLNGGTVRHFLGATRVTDGIDGYDSLAVVVAGDQWRDGTIERYVSLDGNYQLTPELARKVAADLIAAADEVEQMAGYDRIELAPASVDLSRYSVREVVDELVRRLGVDEVCRQLDVASVDELNRCVALADGDRAARADKP